MRITASLFISALLIEVAFLLGEPEISWPPTQEVCVGMMILSLGCVVILGTPGLLVLKRLRQQALWCFVGLGAFVGLGTYVIISELLPEMAAYRDGRVSIAEMLHSLLTFIDYPPLCAKTILAGAVSGFFMWRIRTFRNQL